jgi:hypothetical protein
MNMTVQLSFERRRFPGEELRTAWRELVAWIGFRVFCDLDDETWLALGPLAVHFNWRIE